MLRECLAPARYSTVLKGEGDPSARFRTLLALLGQPPAVPGPVALELARAADALLARTDELPPWVDAGLAARIQSSFGHKGRLLATVARTARPKSILELGTAFGMSAAFLAKAAPEARIVTLEPSAPHAAIARELLDSVGAANVELLELASDAAEPAVRRRLGSIDMLFHDALHSREAYIQDFELYEPLLTPGAVVIYDDINFRYQSGPDTQTYAGWTQVARHDRVTSAIEVDGLYGLLELSG